MQNNANQEVISMRYSNPYQALADYLNYLEAAYQLHLCVKDYAGFIPIDKELNHVLAPYLGHTNPYCMYIKQDPDRYRHCLSMMKKMAVKCLSDQCTYCGICYAGVKEYVAPIMWNGQLLGALTAGFLEVPPDEAESRIRRAMQHADAKEQEEALTLYHQNILPTAVSSQVILPALNITASYLAMTYRMSHESMNSGALTKNHKPSSSEEILRQVLSFIHQEYTNRITIGILTEVCHCSESYLNHLIKKKLGVSLSTYINKLRIERAKEYLLETNETMLSIAIQVGFSDANYFARVFQQLMGISPSEFRRRYR